MIKTEERLWRRGSQKTGQTRKAGKQTNRVGRRGCLSWWSAVDNAVAAGYRVRGGG